MTYDYKKGHIFSKFLLINTKLNTKSANNSGWERFLIISVTPILSFVLSVFRNNNKLTDIGYRLTDLYIIYYIHYTCILYVFYIKSSVVVTFLFLSVSHHKLTLLTSPIRYYSLIVNSFLNLTSSSIGYSNRPPLCKVPFLCQVCFWFLTRIKRTKSFLFLRSHRPFIICHYTLFPSFVYPLVRGDP